MGRSRAAGTPTSRSATPTRSTTQPAKAWAAYDQALTFPPHQTDESLTADRDRVRDSLTAKQGQEAGRTPIIIRYRDEVTEEFSPRSVVVSLDFAPVLTKDKNASELHAPDFQKIYSGSVAAGDHVLVLDVAHGCAPSAGPQVRALDPPPRLAVHQRRPHAHDAGGARVHRAGGRGHARAPGAATMRR